MHARVIPGSRPGLRAAPPAPPPRSIARAPPFPSAARRSQNAAGGFAKLITRKQNSGPPMKWRTDKVPRRARDAAPRALELRRAPWQLLSAGRPSARAIHLTPPPNPTHTPSDPPSPLSSARRKGRASRCPRTARP